MAYLPGTKLQLIKRYEEFRPITPLTLARHSGNIRWFPMKMFKSVMKKMKMKLGQNGSFSFTNVGEILDSHDDPGYFQLPPHFRCVSNTINLLESTDADKALCDVAYKRQYHATFSKCIALWDVVNKSSKAADAVKEVYDKQLVRLVVTRWNSEVRQCQTFDGLSQNWKAC